MRKLFEVMRSGVVSIRAIIPAARKVICPSAIQKSIVRIAERSDLRYATLCTQASTPIKIPSSFRNIIRIRASEILPTFATIGRKRMIQRMRRAFSPVSFTYSASPEKYEMKRVEKAKSRVREESIGYIVPSWLSGVRGAL